MVTFHVSLYSVRNYLPLLALAESERNRSVTKIQSTKENADAILKKKEDILQTRFNHDTQSMYQLILHIGNKF